MRKTHSMFYAYLQCSVASVLSRGMGLSPGFYFIYFIFCSLEREPSLWENTWPWEILRIWESFPGTRLGNQDLWGGEKESTFDTERRVETGTYHWEGRKPFIQTFESYLLHYVTLMHMYVCNCVHPYVRGHMYIIVNIYAHICVSVCVCVEWHMVYCKLI